MHKHTHEFSKWNYSRDNKNLKLEFWHVITNLSYFKEINAKNLFFFLFAVSWKDPGIRHIANIMGCRVRWFCKMEGFVQGLDEKPLRVAAWQTRDKKWMVHCGEADSKEIWIFKTQSEMRGITLKKKGELGRKNILSRDIPLWLWVYS